MVGALLEALPPGSPQGLRVAQGRESLVVLKGVPPWARHSARVASIECTDADLAALALVLPSPARLRKLKLRGDFVDLSAALAFSRLTDLTIVEVRSSLAGLEGHPALTTLQLENVVNDLSALAHLPALKSLLVCKRLRLDLLVHILSGRTVTLISAGSKHVLLRIDSR